METKTIEQIQAENVERYLKMSDAEVVEELIGSEGCEGFSYGLHERAELLLAKLKDSEHV